MRASRVRKRCVPLNQRRAHRRFVTRTVHLFFIRYSVYALILSDEKSSCKQRFSATVRRFTLPKPPPRLPPSPRPLPRAQGDTYTTTLPTFSSFFRAPAPPLPRVSPSPFSAFCRANWRTEIVARIERGVARRAAAMTREPVIKPSFNLLLVIHDY